MSEYKRRPRLSPKEYLVFAVVLVITLVAKLIYELFWDRIYLFLSVVGQFGVNLIGILGIALVGYVLYLIRQKWRVTYGTIEVVFALVYGWYAINKVGAVGYVETISVIASVYLVVRGVDNIVVGRQLKEEEHLTSPKDTLT